MAAKKTPAKRTPAKKAAPSVRKASKRDEPGSSNTIGPLGGGSRSSGTSSGGASSGGARSGPPRIGNSQPPRIEPSKGSSSRLGSLRSRLGRGSRPSSTKSSTTRTPPPRSPSQKGPPRIKPPKKVSTDPSKLPTSAQSRARAQRSSRLQEARERSAAADKQFKIDRSNLADVNARIDALTGRITKPLTAAQVETLKDLMKVKGRLQARMNGQR